MLWEKVQIILGSIRLLCSIIKLYLFSNRRSTIAFFAALTVTILTVELWLPIMFLLGAIKLLVSFSLPQAWNTAVAVPSWVWETTFQLF